MITNREIYRELMGEVELLKGETLVEKVADRIGVNRFDGSSVCVPGSNQIRLPWTAMARVPEFLHLRPAKESGKQTAFSGQLNRQRAARSLAESLDIRIDEQNRTIIVSYTSFDRELVSQVLSVLTDMYLSAAHTTRASHSFAGRCLELRADSLFERLTEIEAELTAGMAYSHSERKSRSTLAREYASLRYRIERNRIALISARSRIRELELHRSTPEQRPSTDIPAQASPNEKRFQLELITEHLKRASALAESVTLGRQFRDISTVIRQRHAGEERQNRLRQERDLILVQYQQLVAGLERVHYNAILESALIPHVSVMTPPTLPRRIPPDRTRIVAWSLTGALAAVLACKQAKKKANLIRRNRVHMSELDYTPDPLLRQSRSIPAGRITPSRSLSTSSRPDPHGFIADPDSRDPDDAGFQRPIVPSRSGNLPAGPIA